MAERGCGEPVRAAQYVRMSTEHQKYSIENQSIAIAAYGLERGYRIVRSYADAAVSGLTLAGREGLKALLADVVGGRADFQVVLVYDVSRWGRFQDPDESAHYEYLCRMAGVAVEYCAEPFENDASLTSVLVKHLKRAMAAEYSRELSVRVSAAQRNLARLGYKQGGPAGYGYRRQIAAEAGAAGEVLACGQQKSLRGERVVFALGDPREVETVRRIFRLFAIAGLGRPAIAAQLNGEGVPSPSGGLWSASAVGRILRNEKYAGVYVFGLRRNRLGRAARWSRPGEVVREAGKAPAIVSPALFGIAQQNRARRWGRLDDEALLERLRGLWTEKGRLSARLIARADMPGQGAYIHRFGSLARAYELVGYVPDEKHSAAMARLRRANLRGRGRGAADLPPRRAETPASG